MKIPQEPAGTSSAVRPGKIFYGWYIVAAGVVSSFINSSIFTVGLSILIKDVREELGWSMVAISIGFSLKQLETGILAPLSGYLIDRLGPRIPAIIGTIVMAVGLLLFARMDSLGMFYLAAIVIALGQGLGSYLAFLAPLMHWFYRKRGQASSFLATGRGLAYLSAVPLTFLLVHFGWRTTATIAAIAFCAIVMPASLVLRQRPEPYGYLPDGDRVANIGQGDGHTPTATEKDSYTLKEAIRSAPFWLVLFSRAMYGFSLQIQTVHLIPHMRNAGFSAEGAALMFAVYGIIQVPARLGCGWLADRLGRHLMLITAFCLLALGWFGIASLSPHTPWAVVLYFLFYGGGQALHAVADQTILADFFGPRRFATISGFMSPVVLPFSVAGPIFAGFMFDAFGNYQLAMIIVGLLCFLGAPAIFLAGRPTLSGQPALRR